MGAHKGHKKMGGRQKGSSNKVTGELRNRIKDFLDNKFEEVLKSWDKLDPPKKIALYERFMNYVLPKMMSANVEMTTEEKKSIDFKPIMYIGGEKGTRTIEYEGNEEEYLKTLIEVDPTGKHLFDGMPTIIHVEFRPPVNKEN